MCWNAQNRKDIGLKCPLNTGFATKTCAVSIQCTDVGYFFLHCSSVTVHWLPCISIYHIALHLLQCQNCIGFCIAFLAVGWMALNCVSVERALHFLQFCIELCEYPPSWWHTPPHIIPSVTPISPRDISPWAIDDLSNLNYSMELCTWIVFFFMPLFVLSSFW